VIVEPAVTRDHTERMMAQFGITLQQRGSRIQVQPPQRLLNRQIDIPADISSAAFFILAGVITPESDITIERVGVNPSRAGILEILSLMGADISLENPTELCGEPVADIRVRYAPLQGITIPEHLVSISMDEFPAIFIAAASASGKTKIHGIGELRYKESDRIEAMMEGLQRMGIEISVDNDNVEITGGRFSGGRIQSYEDHRIAMAFAIAGTQASSEVVIEACNQIATSFPEFLEVAQKAGLRIHKEETNVS